MSTQIISKRHPSSNKEFVSRNINNNFRDYRKQSSIKVSNLIRTNFVEYFQLAKRINGFLNLPPNWDSYDAKAISTIATNTAIETLHYLNIEGLLSSVININVFPMRDGGVQFEFDGNNICSEFEISPDGELTFLLFDKDDNIANSIEIFELSELSTFLS
jgi:hypothetical protein